MGIFLVYPSFGIIEAGSQTIINVECSPDIIGNHKEVRQSVELAYEIRDACISFNLSCMNGINLIFFFIELKMSIV